MQCDLYQNYESAGTVQDLHLCCYQEKGSYQSVHSYQESQLSHVPLDSESTSHVVCSKNKREREEQKKEENGKNVIGANTQAHRI